ncbi:dihydroorotate dehydrogenase [Pectinatus cerevisiiphilus]|uniref:Dihydroorotate dehydrogenase n=1 Tax=Pectinatus cerevisiiphilus TaxID=86956 RepID=A0A4R3KF35_9FIRM|nr:dihydroorotate dehydrogenase [Pectinatus cerevisiiphilus]TCS81897.1 dihydroorotate dehydrogenase (NAD+) catalytic subunit [Pectinatus cerevisiiphilus]
MSEISLKTELAGIKMNSPIMTASGTFGFGEEFEDFADFSTLGAIVVKGTTLQPRSGNKGIRIAETPAGMLNCIGLENPGVKVFIDEISPRIKKYNCPIIVNISGSTVEEYGELANMLDIDAVAAVELNVSCPNVKEGGIAFGVEPKSMMSVIRAAKKNTHKPVIIKLSPNVTDIAMMAKAAEEAGADAISLINTLMGMAIDINTWRPVLGNITGGLSGPAVKPVALRMVWEVRKAVSLPIIGMGGIMNAQDAIEFFLAGADAVAVGTANFVEPDITVKIYDGLEKYLGQKNLTDIKDIIGKLQA